jgi:hypothetical protein
MARASKVSDVQVSQEEERTNPACIFNKGPFGCPGRL